MNSKGKDQVSGRVLAIGDIHGCNTALETLLGQLQIEPRDTVVLLGDIVDRGPGTREVIETLLELGTECQLKYVMGNHEQMMLEALDKTSAMPRWLTYGGREVLESYGSKAQPIEIPASHLDFIRSAADYFQTPTEVFIHGNLEPGIPMEEQTESWLRWVRFQGEEEPLETGQRVICGHTVQKSGLPTSIRGWVCIDTGVYRDDGWLTCLDVQTDEFFQANEQGLFRVGQI